MISEGQEGDLQQCHRGRRRLQDQLPAEIVLQADIYADYAVRAMRNHKD
jgi:hypothetical protein